MRDGGQTSRVGGHIGTNAGKGGVEGGVVVATKHEINGQECGCGSSTAPKTTQPLTQAHSATSPKLSLTRSTSQTDPRHGTGPPSALCSWFKVLGLTRWWTKTVGQTFPTWWNKPRHSSQISACLYSSVQTRRMAWILQMCQELGDHFGVSGACHRQTISPTSPVRKGSGAHRASQPHPSHCKGQCCRIS